MIANAVKVFLQQKDKENNKPVIDYEKIAFMAARGFGKESLTLKYLNSLGAKK